jgi:hypothetical protein
MDTSITVSGRRYCGGFMPAPTPAFIEDVSVDFAWYNDGNLPPGVPVMMTLPFCKVVPEERYDTK